MHIEKIKILNFRLLEDAELSLEPGTTVIVGRNNSGKTSLSEVLRRFVGDAPAVFQLEDFSSSCYDKFCVALGMHLNGTDSEKVRAELPAIQVSIHFRYDPTKGPLGPLHPFVIDLDPKCSESIAVARYELGNGRIADFFEGLLEDPLDDEKRRKCFRDLRERIPKMFDVKISAIDPGDATNIRDQTPASLRALVMTGFINAQRGLDDVTSRNSDVLAKVVESLFASAALPGAEAGDKKTAEELALAIRDIQTQIDQNVDKQFKELVPALTTFGYPGLGGQELLTETLLDVQKLLSNFMKVRYAGYGGVALPEAYNGLGIRNLVLILLQLASFFKAFKAKEVAPGTHIVFIEEPEAHLHPQMQETFIRQLPKIAAKLVGADPQVKWPVQFVISTHSSHLANEARFETIRYFLSQVDASGKRRTKIKDLNIGIGGKKKEERDFLHQYLTLTKCDLFFADKAILVEGLSERLMLPRIVEKLEKQNPELPQLSTQYVTVLEVGGAYAHLFFDLLDFLQLPALIVTDIDAVEKAGGEACEVHRGTVSSNTCINTWFGTPPLPSIESLRARTDQEKTNGERRLAYQVPEEPGGPCGRTFEDAFILANGSKFGMAKTTSSDREVEARVLALKQKKSSFALRFAIDEADWNPPRYISDAVHWLAALHHTPPASDQKPVATAGDNEPGSAAK